MSDQDVTFARTAFEKALPPVEYRGRAPRSSSRAPRRVLAVGAMSLVAAGALIAVTSATNTTPAWSATPSSLSSADAGRIDQQCRAASSDIMVLGAQQAEPAPQGDGVVVGGGTVSGGSGAGSALAGGTPVPVTVHVGDLPLLLIDSRGSSALALYGDAQHHVICTIDSETGTTLSPDSGAWSSPVAPALLAANAGVAMGATVVGDATGAHGFTQLVGMIDTSVRGLTVNVPGVGTVTATVAGGYYSLFIPRSLIASAPSDWDAALTLRDGTTRSQTLDQSSGIGAGGPTVATSQP